LQEVEHEEAVMSPGPTHELLEVEHFGAVTVARFMRRTFLESDAIESISAFLRALVSNQGRSLLVLNFARVESVTSAMLGTFVTLLKDVEGKGGRLVFCKVDSFLSQIFQICQLPSQITIYKEEAEALAALAAPVAGPL
jgi:anti-anti-sigma factor